MSTANIRSLRSVEVSTLSHIAILLFISILAIIHLKSIIQPLVVAVLLFFLIRPPAQWLEEKYGHPLAAYGILTTGVVLVFFFVGNILYQSLQDFSGEAVVLEEKLTEKIERFSDLSIYGYSIDVSALPGLVTVERINTITTEFMGTLAGFTGSTITVFIFLIFIIVEAETLPRRLQAAYPDEMDRFSSIVQNAGEGINTYVITKASVAFGQAIIVALILSYMGIPGWFMWASITFLLDFVPYVGAPLSFIPPTIISFILFEPLTALLILGTWAALTEAPLGISIQLHHSGGITKRLHPDDGPLDFVIPKGDEFSVFALEPCEKVSISGARWSLNSEPLNFSTKGLHNQSIGKNISISTDGILAIIFAS